MFDLPVGDDGCLRDSLLVKKEIEEREKRLVGVRWRVIA